MNDDTRQYLVKLLKERYVRGPHETVCPHCCEDDSWAHNVVVLITSTVDFWQRNAEAHSREVERLRSVLDSIRELT